MVSVISPAVAVLPVPLTAATADWQCYNIAAVAVPVVDLVAATARAIKKNSRDMGVEPETFVDGLFDIPRHYRPLSHCSLYISLGYVLR